MQTSTYRALCNFETPMYDVFTCASAIIIFGIIGSKRNRIPEKYHDFPDYNSRSITGKNIHYHCQQKIRQNN